VVVFPHYPQFFTDTAESDLLLHPIALHTIFPHLHRHHQPENSAISYVFPARNYSRKTVLIALICYPHFGHMIPQLTSIQLLVICIDVRVLPRIWLGKRREDTFCLKFITARASSY
jgi:hypothetical protein